MVRIKKGPAPGGGRGQVEWPVFIISSGGEVRDGPTFENFRSE